LLHNHRTEKLKLQLLRRLQQKLEMIYS